MVSLLTGMLSHTIVMSLLTLAAAEPLCTTCQRPVHSWGTLPVSFHNSKRATDTHGGFSTQELEVIRRFPLVTIEKWQGDQASEFVWQEDAWVYAATQVKAANPNASVVVWLDSQRIYSGWTWPYSNVVNKTLNPDANEHCSTGHFQHGEFLEMHPQYLLKNSTGLPALETYGNCHVYDFSKVDVQNYWRDMCLNMTRSGVIDGCGADAAWLVNSDICLKYGLDDEACQAQRTGHRQMMNDTARALGEGILVGKDAYMIGDYVSAALHEGCDASNSTINTLRNLAKRALDAGQRWVYQCHTMCPAYLGTKYACEDSVESQVAAFLIGAGEDHYFASGLWNTAEKIQTYWLSEFFERPLGEPLSDGTYDIASGVWSRSFASGTKVRFDTLSNEGNIQWASAEVNTILV